MRAWLTNPQVPDSCSECVGIVPDAGMMDAGVDAAVDAPVDSAADATKDGKGD